jgi:hypothetical protein
MYARINENGDIVEFPIVNLDILRFGESIPDDVIEVDTETNKPTLTWDKILLHDSIENINGSYILNYTISERFSKFEDKKKCVENLIIQYNKQNEAKFNSLVKEINFPYKQEEINSWNLQVQESKNYLNGINDCAFIELLANQRGIEISELVTKIMEKHMNYVNSYGDVLGMYQKNRELLSSINLDDETTFDLIDQYGWQ